jgi:hypothetical protein
LGHGAAGSSASGRLSRSWYETQWLWDLDHE